MFTCVFWLCQYPGPKIQHVLPQANCPQQTQTTFLFFNGCQEPFRLTPPTSGTYHVNVNDIFKAR